MREWADRELVQLAQQGDKGAIGELFSRYWRAARAAAFGVTGELSSAEDAASEAFQQALTGIDSLRDPDRFGSWLRTIVLRKARLGLQRRYVAVDACADDLFDQHERADDAVVRIELGALVRRAIRGLPPALREAIALVYLEGYSPETAAQFLDIPPGTLRRRLHDGRTRLHTTVEQLLQGSKYMNEERNREIQKLKTMIGSGEFYQAMRGSLTLRPPAREIVAMLTGWDLPGNLDRAMVERWLQPSDRVSDPTHPVGSIAKAIRKALPDFQEGVAAGRPGAFLHASRAMVRQSKSGHIRSTYEQLKDSPNAQAFRQAKDDIRFSDVLDLTWTEPAPLELRSVQALLERLTSAVLPGAPIRFSSYDEPRYRSALQLQADPLPARAACGGVLAPWPGSSAGTDTAHLRIFLEPWATAQSGQIIELHCLPEQPKPA